MGAGVLGFRGGVLHNRGCKSSRVAGGPLMEKDYRGWCESLVALGEVEVVRLDDREGRPLVMEVCLAGRPVCGGCGGGCG